MTQQLLLEELLRASLDNSNAQDTHAEGFFSRRNSTSLPGSLPAQICRTRPWDGSRELPLRCAPQKRLAFCLTDEKAEMCKQVVFCPCLHSWETATGLPPCWPGLQQHKQRLKKLQEQSELAWHKPGAECELGQREVTSHRLGSAPRYGEGTRWKCEGTPESSWKMKS